MVNAGALTITEYTGPGGVVTIPSAIDGLPVSRIGFGAFAGCSNLRSITVPDSLSEIGYGAFAGCTNLRSITIPDSVNEIGSMAFEYCYSLTNLIIPGSVTNIGDFAFLLCYGLTSVSIPGSVATIGDCAFRGCYGLTSISLSEGVSRIGEGAFSSCYGLTNISLPPSVAEIGLMVFRESTHLSAITVDALNTNYSSVDGVLFDKLQTMLVEYPAGKSGSYTIPNSVTQLRDYAFAESQVTSVSIPDSVSFIPNSAFSFCYSLTNVTIPNSVTNIEGYAFYYCENLRSIAVPYSVCNIGDGAFCSCNNLDAILVDPLNPSYMSVDGVLFEKDLGTLLAYPANRSGSYTIPGSVRRIGESAFELCYGLTSVSIPNGVSTIPNRAFFDCWSLTNVTIPASVTSIGGAAFAHCASLKRVLLPEHLTDLGEGAFTDCTELKAVYFTGNAPHLEGPYVFSGDGQATVYYLPGHTGWDRTLGGLPTVLWSGTYHGLFHVAGKVSWESAGAFSMRATAKGRFSGQLLLAGRRHSLSGAFDAVGQASVTISRRNARALQVQFQMAGFDQITGSVSDGNWTAELTADRTAFDGKSSLALQMGRYTMVIPGADPWSTTVPSGYGYGTVVVDKSGHVHLSGVLADNTRITKAAPLSRDGVWPVYVSLYRGQGLLLGWLTFTNSQGADLSGLLQWNKPTDGGARFYPGGFLSDTSVQGWRYTRPKVLPFNKASLVLSGAGLQQDLTNHVVLQANNRVTSTNKTTLTFTLSTGAFRGSVPNPASPGTKPIPFSGVLVQNQNIENTWPMGYGCGWFMGTDQCGVIHVYGDETN